MPIDQSAPRPQRDADQDQALLAEIGSAAAVDVSRATALASAALAAGLNHPLVLKLVAQQAAEAGRFEEALSLFRRAATLAPRSALIMDGQGGCLAALGRTKDALAAFNEALALKPNMLSALCNKASTSIIAGDLATARESYERAVLLHPGEAEPLAALAALAVRQGEFDRARAYAARSLSINPAQSWLQLTLAQADVHERAYAAAEARLRPVLLRAGDLAPEHRAPAQGLLGDALDGLDRPAEAFAAYTIGNQELRELSLSASRDRDGETALERVVRLRRYFETAVPEAWKPTAGPDGVGADTVGGHVFLLGFQRSGTTLLEQVLASHPDVVALEERGHLAEAGSHWLADTNALDRLSTINVVEAQSARELYWRRVRDSFDVNLQEKHFIDKLPMHTVYLPIIAKLFPDARVIFARRDPRDIVLSCFRRRFTMNPTNFQLLTIEGAAEYYDEVMSLADNYLNKVKLNVTFIRNEDLVVGFEAEITKILEFIGVGWNDSVRTFAARARSQANTPSAHQVTRGLNSDGVGQWRRYQEQLAPVLPTLQRWVDAFGYADADSGAPASPNPALSAPNAKAEADAAQRAAYEAQALLDTQNAVSSADWTRAFDVAETALAGGLGHPLFYRIRALHREQLGLLPLAIADFEAALAAVPADFGVLNALGLCLAKAGRIPEALERLDAALAIEPNFAPAQFNRGWTLESAGDLIGARAAYERAVELDPGHAQALGNLASIATQHSDWTGARVFAARAFNLDNRLPSAALALARADLAEGALDTAERRLRGLLSDRIRPNLHERSVALTILGDVLDRRQQPREAFAAYRQANDGLRSLYAPRFSANGMETGLAFVRRLAAYFDATPESLWLTPTSEREASSPVKGHVFVVGFPRSGTTLLGQVLASHPEIVALDEQETLVDAVQAFMMTSDGLDRLADPDDRELEHQRQAYWSGVARLGAEVSGKVFVDKLPMNTLGLPLITRLFPKAKVLFARRDPRDVVLSSYRRQFVINPSTWELLTLPGAARFYDAVMELAEIYMRKLTLDLRVQKLEGLIDDFEGETRALFEFISEDWHASVFDFNKDVQARAIATPSGVQIARGLDAGGVGQWRRYRQELGSVLPLLQPWVKRFGYTAD